MIMGHHGMSLWPPAQAGQGKRLRSRRRRPQNLLFWFPLIMLCAFCLPRSHAKCLEKSGVLTKRYFYMEEKTLDLRLEISDRVSHQLITHILKILLKEVVGYVNISLVEKLDYMNATLVLNRISGCPANGECKKVTEWKAELVPETMINLEVWMGPGFNTESWVSTGRLEHCGPLGPVGRFGWFIPYYVAKHGWDKQRIYDHWRALQNDNIVQLLDLSEDMAIIKQYTRKDGGNETYCNFKGCTDGIYYPKICKHGAVCATLLSKYPAISNGMIHELIHHLKLKVKVAWIGPRMEDYVYKRTLQGKPVMFFSWKPNTITSSKNYTNIAFPRCEDLQIGSPFPSNCAFEINQLNKMAWAGLKEGAAEAIHVVRAMNINQVQYQQLMVNYERRHPSQEVADISCEWVRGNKKVWSAWMPRDLSDKISVYIGGIFPLSGHSYISKGIIPAVKMAIDAVNRNNTILNDYKMQLLTEDGQCSPDHAMKGFIKYVTSKEFPRIVGILGPACSDTVEALAGVAKHYHATIISYSAEGAIFNNNKDYPYFFRTIPSNKQFKYVYLHLFKRMGWTRAATLSEEGTKYPEYLSITQDFLQSHGISFIINRKFPRDRTSNNMTQYLDDLRRKNVRIIIGDMYEMAARAIMCEAFRHGMTARQGYVWFFPRWFTWNWYDTGVHNSLESSAAHKVPCTKEEMLNAINGHLSLAYANYNDDHKIMQEGISVREWKQKYYKTMFEKEHNDPDDYAGYAYDAVWVYALGLDSLLRQNHSYISTLHTSKTARKFVKILNATDFEGVSGQIHFVGPSRISVINVLQWIDNKTNWVGRYVPMQGGRGFLELNDSRIKWLTSDKRVPDDGREVPVQCAIEALRSALGVSCEAAIVVLNVVSFGLISIIMLSFFLFFKQRYEKRVRFTEERMKELGLITANSILALDQWEIPRECVVINRKIGEGAFGTVYGGEVHLEELGWVSVAVKTLKIGSTIEEKLDFLSEAEMMKRFDHQNVIRLLGVCTRGVPVYTIMEFMLYGDLKTFLLGRRHLVSEKDCANDSNEVSDRKLTSMALDVARGLSYLAEMKYVHRDLACRNCLVNTNRVVKIGDFGMTRPMYDSDYYRFCKKGLINVHTVGPTSNKLSGICFLSSVQTFFHEVLAGFSMRMLPVRWMAPESLADGLFTPMSDVWSYGVLLFEIITFGSFPFQGLSNNQVLDHVKKGNTLSIPAKCNPTMKELLRICWSQDPHMRPTASTIVEILANNQCLVSPCLDLPSAVVEIEGTNSLELQILDRTRKFSLGNANRITPRKRANTMDIGECAPFCRLSTKIGTSSGMSTPLDLELNRISSSTGTKDMETIKHNGLTKPANSPSINARYVTLFHGKDSSDSINKDGRSNSVTHL